MREETDQIGMLNIKGFLARSHKARERLGSNWSIPYTRNYY